MVVARAYLIRQNNITDLLEGLTKMKLTGTIVYWVITLAVAYEFISTLSTIVKG